jgi:hypothetical protein
MDRTYRLITEEEGEEVWRVRVVMDQLLRVATAGYKEVARGL